MKQAVIEYCNKNAAALERMTTPEIAKRLKREFPKVPVMVIVRALGEWCTEYRPKIAG